MRQTYRQEMKYLLELTGYEIVNVYGGYRKATFEPYVLELNDTIQPNSPFCSVVICLGGVEL